MQTQKQFQAQKFAAFHYAQLLKARHSINSSPNRQNAVKYSSRNLTHMAKYQESLQKNKLVDKLIEIYVKPVKKKRKLKKQSHKSLLNPYIQKQKCNIIKNNNVSLCDKIFNTKSTYSNEFSKKRQRKLRSYTKILKKKDSVSQIQNQYFNVFQKFMICSQSNFKTKKLKDNNVQIKSKRVLSARPFINQKSSEHNFLQF